MTTTLYFIRHCHPNYDNHDDFNRELSEKGLQDRQFLLDFFVNKKVDMIFSSPYKRAYDTVKPLAKKLALDIHTISDFRERKIDNVWIENFTEFTKKQWADLSYKLSDGESLREVQDRNIRALRNLLVEQVDHSILIGSHGTAISTIIKYFDDSFDYDAFDKIKSLMPFILEMTFEHLTCQSISLHNIFTGDCHEIYPL